VTSVARRGGGVRWRSLVPYSAGWRGAERGLEGGVGRRVVWCPSVPDVDKRVVFVAALLRCPMLTGGDFGCAAGWWGAVRRCCYSVVRRGWRSGGLEGGGLFGVVAAGLVFGARCLGSVPDVDKGVTSVARRGGGVRWRSLVPYSAGRRGAARGLVPFGARCLGSVPDVDRG
jgi:hypothetical protein